MPKRTVSELQTHPRTRRTILALSLLICAGCLPTLPAQKAPAGNTPGDTAKSGPTAVQLDNAESTSKPDDTQVPEANPARPTVTNPAHIPPVGYLQFEQGFLQGNSSPQLTRQFSVNQNTKLSVKPWLMVQFFSQPFAFTDLGSGHTWDTGDLQAGAQVLLIREVGRRPTIAMGYVGRVRSGNAPDLDIGSFSQSALLLISGDLGQFHYDSNFVVSEQSSGPARRAQYGQTLSVSHSIFTPDLSLSGELWHFTQPLVPVSSGTMAHLGANAVGTLWALGYALCPNLVLDAGIEHGLTSTSTQWEGVAGFTYLLPKRLWNRRLNP
ncbi:MAG TPA: hypothetical protein VGD59_11445 [Acidisarcina sp.]